MAQPTIAKVNKAMLIISIALFVTIIVLISLCFYLRQRERHHRLPCTTAPQTCNSTRSEPQVVIAQPQPQPPQPLLPSTSTTLPSTAPHSPALQPPPPCYKEAPIAELPAIPLAELSVYRATPEPSHRTEPLHSLLINKPLRSHPVERRCSTNPFRSMEHPPHLNEPLCSHATKSRHPAERLHQTSVLVSPISPLQTHAAEPLMSHKNSISPLNSDPASPSASTETTEEGSDTSDWPRSSPPNPTFTSATSRPTPILAPLFAPLHTPAYVTASGRPSTEVLSPITENSLEGFLSESSSEMDVEVGMSWFDSSWFDSEEEQEDMGGHGRGVSMGYRKQGERDGWGKFSW